MPHFFTQQLLAWHAANPRILPWTDGPREPYHIWISEVIMQQTRIEQGAPYYRNFISRFPSVNVLANASLNEVLRHWEGLGYYSRARNLHNAAKAIQSHHQSALPTTYDDLLSLPGIGTYTAAAIASFAYDLPYPVVDGNVKRLISRFAGITDPVDSSIGVEKIYSASSQFMKGVPPADFNQAIMNFGALICKPKPLCHICPLAPKCYALKHGVVDILPVKAKKKENKLRYLHFIVLHRENEVLFIKRSGSDVWKDMYVPPFIETSSVRAPTSTAMQSWIADHLGVKNIVRLHSSGTSQQILSHQTITARFHHFEIKSSSKKPAHAKWLSKKTVSRVAKPRIIVKSLQEILQ
jgi:A/G-specific adenine glycosylase